ncbi:hypothetical protein DPMN_017576 [Dreissena polymorpha]|uniref:Uncharacterized protein n=1 Tax=Dreissena polymorpha TaxID=45954 RepID=A0A9D4S5K1_DREPO|nr:hypothetical protein DPMN_017576 [Dreissena polymorpha]
MIDICGHVNIEDITLAYLVVANVREIPYWIPLRALVHQYGQQAIFKSLWENWA